jgi:hypothetical protein
MLHEIEALCCRRCIIVPEGVIINAGLCNTVRASARQRAFMCNLFLPTAVAGTRFDIL